jgi:predicted O-methyltransferase YrrM
MLQQRPFSWFSRRVAHLVGPASMHEIYRYSALLTASPAEAAAAVLGDGADYGDEYARVRERLDVRLDSADRRYPDYYTVEDATASLLYTLVRHAKPSLAVEVGVADGRSTQVILSALDANGSGRLISVDVRKDVGGGARGHPRWSLRVHSPGRTSSRQLRRLFAEIGPPDLFFHDALHSYYDQYAEYLAAWEHMRPGSLFVSDDVDWSFAFYDLTTAFSVRPVVLTEGRKASGLFRRP